LLCRVSVVANLILAIYCNVIPTKSRFFELLDKLLHFKKYIGKTFERTINIQNLPLNDYE